MGYKKYLERYTPEQRNKHKRDVWESAKKAHEILKIPFPKEPIDLESAEALAILHKLHCAGYSHTVMGIFTGQKKKDIRNFLHKLRKDSK